MDFGSLIFLGWLALFGGLLNTIADWFLLAFPIAGRDIKMELIAKKPARSVVTGVYVGMIAIPLWCTVIFPLAVLLGDAPVFLTVIAASAIVLMTFYSLVYHVSYIFYDIAYRDFPDSVERVLKEKSRQSRFMLLPGLVLYITLFIAGLLASAPWWWLAANPLVTQMGFSVAARFAPAPVGGYFLTGAGSLGFSAFVLITMLAV